MEGPAAVLALLRLLGWRIAGSGCIWAPYVNIGERLAPPECRRSVFSNEVDVGEWLVSDKARSRTPPGDIGSAVLGREETDVSKASVEFIAELDVKTGGVAKCIEFRFPSKSQQKIDAV